MLLTIFLNKTATVIVRSNIVIKFGTTHIFTAHTISLVFFVADMTVISELRVSLPGSLLLE